MGFPHNTSHIG
jgi:hypothetical protein